MVSYVDEVSISEKYLRRALEFAVLNGALNDRNVSEFKDYSIKDILKSANAIVHVVNLQYEDGFSHDVAVKTYLTPSKEHSIAYRQSRDPMTSIGNQVTNEKVIYELGPKGQELNPKPLYYSLNPPIFVSEYIHGKSLRELLKEAKKQDNSEELRARLRNNALLNLGRWHGIAKQQNEEFTTDNYRGKSDLGKDSQEITLMMDYLTRIAYSNNPIVLDNKYNAGQMRDRLASEGLSLESELSDLLKIAQKIRPDETISHGDYHSSHIYFPKEIQNPEQVDATVLTKAIDSEKVRWDGPGNDLSNLLIDNCLAPKEEEIFPSIALYLVAEKVYRENDKEGIKSLQDAVNREDLPKIEDFGIDRHLLSSTLFDYFRASIVKSLHIHSINRSLSEEALEKKAQDYDLTKEELWHSKGHALRSIFEIVANNSDILFFNGNNAYAREYFYRMGNLCNRLGVLESPLEEKLLNKLNGSGSLLFHGLSRVTGNVPISF